MGISYEAILQGDRLRWIGEAPPVRSTDIVTVRVTLVPDKQAGNGRGVLMAAALESLAALPNLNLPEDPVAWQRQERDDRPLPGRND